MGVAKLLKAQAALHEQLNKSIANYKKTGKARRTITYIKTRIDSLHDIWQRFYDNHLKIHELENGDANEYLQGSLYETTEELYVDNLSEFREELESLSEADEQPLPSRSAPISAPRHGLKLAQISIPPFDGRYSSWRSFHDLFKSLVHKDPNLSKVQKLHYLKTSVTGEAERLLRQFEITEHNYQRAWELLDKRYNNKRVLVKTHIQMLRNQPSIKNEDPEAIKNLIDQTEESLHELQALGINTESWDCMIIDILEEKLPNKTRWSWQEELGSNTELPTYEQFIQFLETRFRTLEAVFSTKEARSAPGKGQRLQKETLNFLSKSIPCAKCNGEHALRKCSTFRDLSVPERTKFIEQRKLCKNCLGSGHYSAKCPSKGTCFHCRKRHHTLLHGERNAGIPPKSQEQSNPSSKLNSQSAENNEVSKCTQNFLAANSTKAMLATALVEIKGHVFRALIDSGSQVSFITEKTCNKLNLTKFPTNIHVTGLSKTQTAHVQKQVSINIQSLRSSFQTQVEALVLKTITDMIPEHHINTSNLQHISGLPLADPKFAEPGPVDLLLGADVYGTILEAGIVKGLSTTPTAQNTHLGWILVGPIQQTTIRNFVATTDDTIMKQLDHQLRQFWETEEIPQPIKHSPEDQCCEEKYQADHKRAADGRYQVALPFKHSSGPDLGQSRYIAVRQFLQMERRLSQNPEAYAMYKKCIHEYFELGHAREVPVDNSNRAYYLPHHAVIKESTTTKLRVVFNASSKTSNGKSLNEQLLTGPTIQPTLWATLLKWRKYRYAMTADIEKMYRMIDIAQEHQTFQRIVWRDHPDQEIKDYALSTVTFGTAPAPFLAIRTLHQLAEDEEATYPLAAKSLRQDFYVDDLLTGAHTIDQGLQKQQELLSTLTRGGFNLRKWTANEPKLIEKIPMDHRELKGELELSEGDSIKTLGIRWHPATDNFCFSVDLPPQKAVYTKRQILSEIASLFDPLGWISPCIITAKIIIQRLWLSGCGWDETIPSSIATDWLVFRDQLQSIQAIKIPRWVRYSPNAQQVELHGFCDASNHAYAAVLYLKVAIKGRVYTTLLASKTRVAPTKPTSLPRLELCGAALLTKLLVQTKRDMRLNNIPIYAWTDSRIALAWIQGQPQRWKTYVANRVAEIQEHIPPASWYHVGSKDNPADCASRGTPPNMLHANNLWWQGPAWLKLSHENWPTQPTQIEPKIEVKRASNFLTIEEFPLLTKFSKFSKLIRVTAYCLRFKQNCQLKKGQRECTNYLTVKELRQAELKVIQLVQTAIFPKEIECLQRKQPLPKKSRILCLNPFLENQILRVGGRLENSMLQYDQKYPSILPNNHEIPNLMIDYIHENTLHGGTQLVVNTLRNKYWLLNALSTEDVPWSLIENIRSSFRLHLQSGGTIRFTRLLNGRIKARRQN